MNRTGNRCFQIVGCLLFGIMTSGCSGDARVASGDKANGRLTVVCTTTMIADLAKELAGDRVEVRGIMKPGEDPHVYDVRPRDAELLSSADLVLTNGFHLEATLDHVIDNNATGKVVALAESAVKKPRTGEGTSAAPDPHCWMNVAYFRGYAQAALEALIEIDPAGAEFYRENAKRYDAKLAALDAWIRKEVATIPRERRVMVTSHDAFEYLGEAYEIDVFAVIGISTEQAPRPQDIEVMEKMIRDRDVRALFIETSVSPTLNQMIQKTAEATGVRIGGSLYSDSLGDSESLGATYLGMMRHNISTIVNALK